MTQTIGKRKWSKTSKSTQRECKVSTPVESNDEETTTVQESPKETMASSKREENETGKHNGEFQTTDGVFSFVTYRRSYSPLRQIDGIKKSHHIWTSRYQKRKKASRKEFTVEKSERDYSVKSDDSCALPPAGEPDNVEPEVIDFTKSPLEEPFDFVITIPLDEGTPV
ncbi:hypothetical protein SARC_00741 [Sphaeroforma arctica JP610]|uniref:Uncharacterized protein n=1 Tax=Sphaeroforma arctica JP610 TaxID=667725 RepID=A0A0L0GFR6_9EUKA|nr:hypothetical protein SARC_00741 [Sphaeroforma arctica JP610]KNC87118.1 hypothetical protein SARC_00741 [Sphaeroforma arctica JP610]|eukprot:XP_014161020.1 hypothetical protein SARC_00741 [Sphaeroforma arctica JP610]